VTPVVLDAGALIALERGNRRMIALVAVIVREEIPAFVPAGVIAQVWRGSSRQHDIARLLATRAIRVDPMDDATARAVGIVLGAAGTSDVVDGHVALLARRARATVYTSDPSDILQIDPALHVVPV
jgi:predicted nucleic acid-binding protein